MCKRQKVKRKKLGQVSVRHPSVCRPTKWRMCATFSNTHQMSTSDSDERRCTMRFGMAIGRRSGRKLAHKSHDLAAAGCSCRLGSAAQHTCTRCLCCSRTPLCLAVTSPDDAGRSKERPHTPAATLLAPRLPPPPLAESENASQCFCLFFMKRS